MSAAEVRLGVCDSGCSPQDLASYFAPIHEPSMAAQRKLRGEGEREWVAFTETSGTSVAALQQFLHHSGFFPFGKIDGICGYRTTGSIRLFQEYVRTVENDASIGPPDGVVGELTSAHIARWTRDRLSADWTRFSAAAPTPEYARWMRLLAAVKTRYLAAPPTLIREVSEHRGRSDSVKVADWSFDPSRIHLIGIRRDEAKPGKRENDDVFVLLIDGVVFKFFGTTDPGKSSNDAGAPFLVPGQHKYRFGWHKMTEMNRVYRALKPATNGVLVIRDGNRDDALTDADLSGQLEVNASINVHWGGRGTSNWSEGCLVICGRGYQNHNDQAIDCAEFAGASYANLATRQNGVYVTKGAYSVLVDLITAFSRDVHAADFMLLYERDLDLEPEIGAAAAAATLRTLRFE